MNADDVGRPVEAAPQPVRAPDAHVARSMTLLLGALSAFAPLSLDMYLPSLPSLQRDFHVSASAAQVTITACLLGLALAQVVIGPLSDRFGRRVPLLIGVVVYLASSLACAFSTSLWLFVPLRFLQGASGAAGIVIARAVVRDVTTGEATLRLFALLQVISGVVPAAAPIIGAQIVRFGSWRLVFWVLAGVGAAIAIATLRVLPETLPRERRSSGGLAATRASFAELLRDRLFMGYGAVSGCVLGAMFAYIAGSPFVLERLYHLSPQEFSGVFAMNATGIVIAGQLTARLAGRVGPSVLMRAGIACSALGGIALPVGVAAHLGLPGLLVALFLVVSAVGIVGPSATALAMAPYAERAGSASGLIGVGQFLIGAICAPLVGAFGVHSAMPMGIVILSFSLAAVVAGGVVATARRPIPARASAGAQGVQ